MGIISYNNTLMTKVDIKVCNHLYDHPVSSQTLKEKGRTASSTLDNGWMQPH